MRGMLLRLLVLSLVVSACSTEVGREEVASTTTTSEATATTTMAVTSTTAAGTVEGMFDVGDHQLYLVCEGTGSPTVVYLHGAIDSKGPVPHANAAGIQELVRGTNQFCAYDRRNVAESDTVDAPQHPDDVLGDLENLLDAAGVEPPYVLLGASFGGLIAYLYANSHPDHVVGMVLLDTPFPDEFLIEDLVPPGDRFEALHEEDLNHSLERISHYEIMVETQQYMGSEPEIPLIYLASLQEPYNEAGWGEWDEQIPDLQAAFVSRFSPGELVWIDSPHFMERAIPEEIADALLKVIALAEQSGS